VATETERIAALEAELAAERGARQALVETSVRLNSLLNLPELLDAIMESATGLLDAETSSLLLLDEEKDELVFAVATGGSETLREMRIPSNQGIAGWVLQNDEAAIVGDVSQDTRFSASVDKSSGFQTRSMLAVPLKIRDHKVGVVEVINKHGEDGFNERDREIATAFAAQAAIAIDNARLYRQLADAVVESRLSYRL
jgi:GAF domain-containing protein